MCTIRAIGSEHSQFSRRTSIPVSAGLVDQRDPWRPVNAAGVWQESCSRGKADEHRQRLLCSVDSRAEASLGSVFCLHRQRLHKRRLLRSPVEVALACLGLLLLLPEFWFNPRLAPPTKSMGRRDNSVVEVTILRAQPLLRLPLELWTKSIMLEIHHCGNDDDG